MTAWVLALMALPGIALSGFGMKEDVADSLAAGFAVSATTGRDKNPIVNSARRTSRG